MPGVIRSTDTQLPSWGPFQGSVPMEPPLVGSPTLPKAPLPLLGAGGAEEGLPLQLPAQPRQTPPRSCARRWPPSISRQPPNPKLLCLTKSMDL